VRALTPTEATTFLALVDHAIGRSAAPLEYLRGYLVRASCEPLDVLGDAPEKGAVVLGDDPRPNGVASLGRLDLGSRPPPSIRDPRRE